MNFVLSQSTALEKNYLTQGYYFQSDMKYSVLNHEMAGIRS
jgi:hypothetical protein